MSILRRNGDSDGGKRERRRQGLVRLIARHERRIEALAAISRRLSWIRLGIVLGGVLLVLVLFRGLGEFWGWVGVVTIVASFAVVANRHGGVEHGIRRGRLWITIRRLHLARMEHRWGDIPVGEMPVGDPDHPFERDLNLTGERSLLHLIDVSVSVGGRLRLRGWLLSSDPDIEEARQRQRLVAELMDLGLARDRLVLAATLSGLAREDRWRGDALLGWLEAKRGEGGLGKWVIVLATLAGVNLLAVALTIIGGGAVIWPATLILYAAFYLHKRGDFADLFQEAISLEEALGAFTAVLSELERFPVGGRPGLQRLLAPFRDPVRRPGVYLKRIGRIAAASATQRNGVLRLLLNLVVPWDYYFAWRLRRAREDVHGLLPLWLDRWYEVEALSSLANYGWLNPEATFPEFRQREKGGGEVFRGVGLTHPLIPHARTVPNDFVIMREGEIAVITGSNMSGKSTFLRTLGVNMALACAGGVVSALHVVTIPFRLYTCINVSDSVNDGISYFYAEVGRLRRLLAEVRRDDPAPVFFLIDEIFRGTNNRERLIGARSFIRALAAEQGVGAVSTHDLELILLADEIPGVGNYHFREEVRDGRMVFDYRLRPGPSPTTNALAIMRSEGLPVDEPAPSDSGMAGNEQRS